MIGRCDRGHIHPASTDEIPSLRALEDITPSKEITKVPSRCFLAAQAIDQELHHCPMVFKIRFECPYEPTVARNDASESFTMVEKSSGDSIVHDAISRLESKISKFEKNVCNDNTNDVMKCFVQFKKAILHHIDEKDSIVGALCQKIDQFESESIACNERIRQLETKVEELQKNASNVTVIEEYTDPIKVPDDAAISNDLQQHKDSLIDALTENTSKLQNQIVEMVVSLERICQLEAKMEELQKNASSLTVTDEIGLTAYEKINIELRYIRGLVEDLRSDVDTALANVSATGTTVNHAEHISQLVIKMKENISDSITDAVDSAFRKHIGIGESDNGFLESRNVPDPIIDSSNVFALWRAGRPPRKAPKPRTAPDQ